MTHAPKGPEGNLRSGNKLRARSLLVALAVILGLVSLALPLVAFFGLEEPGGPFDAPVRVAYYRQIVLAFVLGLVLVGLCGPTVLWGLCNP